MNRLRILLSWCLVIIGIVYCAFSLIANYNALPVIGWDLFLVVKTVLIIPVGLSTALLFYQAWRILLQSGEVFLSYSQAYAILGISQMGKYLPGNVFHYVGRAAMGLKQGIPAATLAVSVWVESLLVLVAATVLILAGALVDDDVKAWLVNNVQGLPFQMLWLVFGLLLAIVAGWFVFRNKLLWLRGYKNFLKPTLLCKVLSYYLLIFVVYGIIVKLIPIALWGHDSSVSFSQAIWRFALCWVAGYIVPGAPAGLGVREALFIKLFAPELGEGIAACVALVFRLITTVGDIVTFVIALYVGRRVLHKKPEGHSVQET